jgi:hypothetical protein
MHRRHGLHGVEHLVHRGRRPFPFVRASRQVRLVDLHDIGVEMPYLRGERVRDRHRQRGQVAVVDVVEHLGEHMRAGQGELERSPRQLAGARTGLRQIERAGADRPFHDGRRTGAEFRGGLRPIGGAARRT